MNPAPSLDALRASHPEWTPWLAVLAQVERALGERCWDEAVPEPGTARAPRAPLLANATLRPDARALAALWTALQNDAAHPIRDAGDAETVFEAALNANEDAMAAATRGAGAEAALVRALGALLPVPFLHACRRRWSDAPKRGWSEGYCLVCGAWPAFAEICGVERARYLRCGRCGSAWQALVLSCPYCGTDDHRTLGALVPEDAGVPTPIASIEVCRRCDGYLKVFTRLRPVAPERVMVDELGSVELDLVATGRGYARRGGTGFHLGVSLDTTPRVAGRRA